MGGFAMPGHCGRVAAQFLCQQTQLYFAKFRHFRRRSLLRINLYCMQPSRFEPLNADGQSPAKTRGRATLPLSRHIILSNWPYRESLNPYGAAATLDWHSVSQSGRWDIAKITRDFKQFLRHSRRTAAIRSGKLFWGETVFILAETLLFAVSPNLGGERDLHVWATCRDKAEAEMERLKSLYLLPPRKMLEIDQFFVLMTSPEGIGARRVTVPPFFFSPPDLALHYGKQFSRWNAEFVAKLNQFKLGLTILQGSPGTGKTSFLRHLLHILRGTHRFYYLPVTVYPLLAAPATVDFWTSENKFYSEKLKVVIIEDAETLLMQRAADNHDSLSNLLNLADGFLGAFLKLHVICTVNTPVEKLDPAVMRPGRLLARYTFNRLTSQQAQNLAAAKGLKIPAQESYSLAEIYNPKSEALPPETVPSTGFHKLNPNC